MEQRRRFKNCLNQLIRGTMRGLPPHKFDGNVLPSTWSSYVSTPFPRTDFFSTTTDYLGGRDEFFFLRDKVGPKRVGDPSWSVIKSPDPQVPPEKLRTFNGSW